MNFTDFYHILHYFPGFSRPEMTPNENDDEQMLSNINILD